MAGLVFGELGRAPEVGDEVRVDGLLLRVLEIEGSRIGKIEVEFGVNGLVMNTDTTPPYEWLFTVPAGVTSVTIEAAGTGRPVVTADRWLHCT